MIRFEDWPERLNECYEARRERAFSWGEADCCLWAADCVEAMTGVDFAAELRGTYKDARSGQRLLKKLGGVRAIAEHRLTEIPITLAQRGDVICVDTPDGEALAVCFSKYAAVQTKNGIDFLPMAIAKTAWKVGR